MTFLLVSISGGLGAALRFVVDSVVAARVRASVPLGTAVVNVTGSFLLGLVTGLVAHRTAIVPPPLAATIGTGFCGGFTTFGTASVETARLHLAGRRGAAALHLVLNVTGSVLAAASGWWLTA